LDHGGYDHPHVYIKHVGHPEGDVVVSAPCALLWLDRQQVIIGNELLAERKIGLMSDFKTLDDPIDKPHGKLNW
jgi:hypothetical protein